MPRWSPFAFQGKPTPADVRVARIYSLVQLPVAAFTLGFLWTRIWQPGDLVATLACIVFTLFGLAIVGLNIRSAWFIKYE